MPTVLVYVDFLIAPHAQVLAGLEQYRQQHGLNWSIDVRTRSSHPPQPSPDAHVLTIHRRMLDFVKPVSPTRPALCLFGNSDAACHCCITLDGAAFGVLAARHFRDLGLRHAAYIPSHNPKIRQSLAPYYTSFQEACARNDMVLDILPCGSDDGDVALLSTLRSLAKPLGIYCATDGQAAWLLDRCLESNIAVPDDVAILGTSDHPHHCVRRHPTISSIAFPWFLMGHALGLSLHRQMSGIARPDPLPMHPVRVVERESTCFLPPGDPLVAAALSWLQQHLRNPQPLANCAQDLACSVPTLSRRFRAVLGTSVKQVHARLRHREAMRLLTNSRHDLRTIAEACGYADVAALSVAFKRLSGWSPGRWRMAVQAPSA